MPPKRIIYFVQFHKWFCNIKHQKEVDAAYWVHDKRTTLYDAFFVVLYFPLSFFSYVQRAGRYKERQLEGKMKIERGDVGATIVFSNIATCPAELTFVAVVG
jgi:hypothetical protein